MRRAQNRRQELDQAREKNQESQRGECRESLREGKRHKAYFVAAIPTLEDGAAENDSCEERREHERKGIRGAAELRQEQASPADFIRHGCGADDRKTDTEKTGRQGGWSRIFFLRKRCGCWHCCWLATREPECERPGEQIERDGNAECSPQPKRGQKQEARDKRSHNRARCVDPVEPREARSEFG